MKTSNAIIAFVCFALSLNLCQAAPTVVGAQAIQSSGDSSAATSLSLSSGCQLYVYAATTGGARPMNVFASGQTVQLKDGEGNVAAQLVVTTDNTNNYTTDTSWHVFGGFGVSGFHYVQGFYGTNPGPGPNLQVPVQFTLTAPAMVAVIGVGSSQTILTFSGVDPLTIDVPSPNGASGTEALSIAHTYLGAGTYTIKETTGDGAPIQDPNDEADLLGVLIFSDIPSIAKSDSPEIPLSSTPTQTATTPSPDLIDSSGNYIVPPSGTATPSGSSEKRPIAFYLILGVGILVFIALAVAIIRMIIPRRGG